MSVLFPKSFNVFPTVFAVGAAGFFASAVGGVWYYFTPKFWSVGYEPVQPGGGFSHQIHAGKLGMDCRYCHTKVEQSPEANIPNVATCFGCHGENRLVKFDQQSHKDKTNFIREAYAVDGAPGGMGWARVHKVPDYVRNFPHNIHISAGVSCYSCHGNITTMPVVFQSQPLSMSWCLDCHRDSAPHLVEKDKVFQLNWVEQHLRDRAAKGDDGLAEGKKLGDAKHLSPPEHCSACHY